MKRSCGVLLPVFSLPSRYGIGCFSKEAYDFVDFLAESGQSYWQILPLGQTGYRDSPYQSFSAFAGNPYFIDPEQLISAGYITEAEAGEADTGNDPSKIDYEKIYYSRYPLLYKAYVNSPCALHPADKWKSAEYDACRKDFEAYIEENKSWLADYSLYSAVKKSFGSKCFIEWDEDIRLRKPEAIRKYTVKLADEIRFYEFLQYLFMVQWKKLKAYANSKGIEIIGDIPIYIAFDSADTWSHPELYRLDEKGYPTVVAGCPPDAFAITGQLWGNPIYDWDYHKKTGFKWWIERVRYCFTLYDVVRIDHFRGFDEYYSIPYGDPTAEFGKWEPGPGYALFAAIKEALGEQQIIAEDLGFLTQSVLDMVARTGYPGMKIIQFAFGGDPHNEHLPHNFDSNSVVYTGTHDNETMRGWYKHISEEEKQTAQEYVGTIDPEDTAWPFIRQAFSSVSNTAIIPLQDYLNLGNEARINTPSTMGNNWMWRMKSDMLTDKLAERMKHLAEIYARA